jgi:hypothetical protein
MLTMLDFELERLMRYAHEISADERCPDPFDVLAIRQLMETLSAVLQDEELRQGLSAIVHFADEANAGRADPLRVAVHIENGCSEARRQLKSLVG